MLTDFARLDNSTVIIKRLTRSNKSINKTTLIRTNIDVLLKVNVFAVDKLVFYDACIFFNTEASDDKAWPH